MSSTDKQVVFRIVVLFVVIMFAIWVGVSNSDNRVQAGSTLNDEVSIECGHASAPWSGQYDICRMRDMSTNTICYVIEEYGVSCIRGGG